VKKKAAKSTSKRGKSYRDEAGLKKFGARIVEIRKAKGITQEELVRRTGFDLRHIGKMERAEIDSGLSHILKIAEGLGVQPYELLTETPVKPIDKKLQKVISVKRL
jgi:transcriptional regulator with XRE-family HTH domain